MKQRKEHQEQEEHVLLININLTRGLVALLALALLMAAFLGYLAWGQGEAVASSRQTSVVASRGMRQYYLAQGSYDGSEALTACADGYHMASLWEILDPSNLKYNTDLGRTQDDSGQGPPSSIFSGGWVRTGFSSYASTTPGEGNCNAWTSSDSGHRGTWVHLPDDWTAGGEDMHVWEVYTGSCYQSGPVWCVEDYIATVYLPLVLRNHG